MRDWWALVAALCGAVSLAILATTPSWPRGSDPAPTDFSAARATGDMRAIARAPPVIGPDMPMPVALPLAVSTVLLAPLAPIVTRGRASLAAGVLLVLAGGVALSVRLDAMAPSVAVYSNDK